METLTPGKIRGLQQCSTPLGAIAVLALDHRNNLRHALRPQAPDTVTADELSEFKIQTIAAVAPASSAVLLDPEFGMAQCIAAGALPKETGLVAALEATGYTGDPTARQSEILPGWSAEKARRAGASAAKLLAYYHPDADSAGAVEALVRRTAEDCRKSDLPLFLEPLSYSPDPSRKKLAPEERRRIVLETARRLVVPGVDIFKAEFPLDIQAEPDESAWLDACVELSKASRAPWVLLSASVDYETYLRQVTVACRAGASGVAAGRAVWQEAVQLTGEARLSFLRRTAYERMARLRDLCSALARPWTDFYSSPTYEEDWYKDY